MKTQFLSLPLLPLLVVASPAVGPAEGCGCLSTKCNVSSFSKSITLLSINRGDEEHKLNLIYLDSHRYNKRSTIALQSYLKYFKFYKLMPHTDKHAHGARSLKIAYIAIKTLNNVFWILN